ncbi:MAG: RluA family pseudouridine synthase, partial [Spirochaetales bacterium]
MNSISFIASNTEPVRADVYIAATQDISRSQLKAGLKTLRINDKNAKLSHILKGEETVCVEWIDSVCENIEAQDIALDILYEDDKVCVVNKAQGMVTHPGAGNMSGTLVNALLWHWGKQSIRIDTLEDTQSGLRSGIVHRLDKDTSGVIITAKDRITEVFLQEQFKKRITKKEYIAIVQGHPPQKKGVIKSNIMRSSRNRKLFT